jgi:hypothetical protein
MSHSSTTNGNWNRHINDDYTVCDSHIAIIKENSCEKGMIIYIYELLIDASYSSAEASNINTYSKIRRLKYSCRSMDINYSKYYMSLSTDAKYLAISWLPNPRMGLQQSMQYCCIYDITAIPFEDVQQIKKDEQTHLLPTLPVQFIQFHGACVFMTGKKLALLNKNQVRVYQMEQRVEEENNDAKTFVIDFSVDLCLKSEDVALFPGYNYCRFTNTYALVSTENTAAGNNSNSANSSVLPASRHHPPRRELRQECHDDAASFGDDTIGFDDSKHQDQDKDELDIDMDDIDVDVFLDHDIVMETDVDYETFCEEHRFIKSNIETIKSAGIINVIVNGQTDLLLWSLRERKLIFFDKLDDTTQLKGHSKDREQQQDLIFAFTPRQNLLAFTRRYNPFQDISKLMDNTPVLNVRDADSGVVISQLHLPTDRLIAGVSQIEFLQDGMYIMIISYSHLKCYFDLYDVISESHLDSFSLEISNQVNTNKCMFILNNQMPLKHGCGLFTLATYSTNPIIDKPSEVMNGTVSTDAFFVNSINYEFKKIGFFQDAFEHCNRFHHSNCCKEDNVLWTLTKLKESRDIHVLKRIKWRRIQKERTEKSCPAYFLDTNRSYLMTYTQLHDFSSFSALTVWKISSAGEVWEDTRESFDKLIRLEEIVYSFPQTAKYSLSTIAGYPSILYNLTCLSRDRIDRMNPVVVQPNNAECIPVLIIKLNDPLDMMDYGSVYSRTKKGDQSQMISQKFTLAIPLNSYTTLECHLHALANECESLGSSKQRFLRNDLAKIVSINLSF